MAQAPAAVRREPRLCAAIRHGRADRSRCLFKGVQGGYLKSKRVFAAKSIDHRIIFDEDMLDRLVRQEIEIMRLLRHPGIPRLHEVYEQESQVILIVEDFDGEQFGDINLHDLTREDITMIAWHLLKIASHFQQNNIVHRDIKGNLMFKPTGSSNQIQVKLIEFGLSVFQGRKLINGKERNTWICCT